MTSVTNCKTWLDAIMIIRCQGDETCRLSTSENSPFWRRGKFQKCLQSLYFSHTPPPLMSSLPFCAGLQFSRDFILKYEKIEGCEQFGLFENFYAYLSFRKRAGIVTRRQSRNCHAIMEAPSRCVSKRFVTIHQRKIACVRITSHAITIVMQNWAWNVPHK